MTTRGGYLCSTECPECESATTRVRNTGIDEDGHTIRSRECLSCGHGFGTVEIALPEDFSFGRTNTKRSTRSKRAARFANDRLWIGSIRVVKGKQSDYCGKGLHLLRGNNLRIAQGQRHCRACENKARRIYKMAHREEMNRRERERYRRRKERNDRTRLSSQNADPSLLPATVG